MSSGTSTARSRDRGNQAPSKADAPSPALSRRLTRTSIPPRNPDSGAVRVIVVISARPPFVARARGRRAPWQRTADTGRVARRAGGGGRAGRRPRARRPAASAPRHAPAPPPEGDKCTYRRAVSALIDTGG